ncbi:MAG TPA: ABC transporter permease [bacterium]|nr:ABC transporter permease [bacterium]
MSDRSWPSRAALAAGAAITVALVACAAFSPWLAPYSPRVMDLCGGLGGPSAAHWLGQDKHGRDVLSLIIYGSRVSVLVGAGTVLLSAAVGFVLGAMAGMSRGLWDQLIMRVVDVLLAFPGILLAIALTAVTGPSIMNVIIALSVRGWVGYARLTRAQVLVEREKGYVEAARAMGAGYPRLIFRHLLPNTMTPIIIEATFGMAGAILAEASLSFLGLGPQNLPTWGAMLSDGAGFLRSAPHLAVFPGIAIMATVMALNFLGDYLRDRFAGEAA